MHPEKYEIFKGCVKDRQNKIYREFLSLKILICKIYKKRVLKFTLVVR